MKTKIKEQEATIARHASERVIDLFFSPAEVSEERLRAYRVVVVIDVLRTAASICVALSNGSRGIIPVGSISAATSLASQLARDDIMLCGEREGKLIDGFHLGNSPNDYTRDRVRGKTLIFGSTNGTPAVVKVAGAAAVFFCGFVNPPSVIEAILNEIEFYPLAILCAGKQNRFSVEDAVCAGQLVEKLSTRLENDPALNDAGRISRLIAHEFGNDNLSMLHNSDHGRYLVSIGLEGDLPHCAASGVLPIVPVLKDGKLFKLENS